jgi:hypothetical protein
VRIRLYLPMLMAAISLTACQPLSATTGAPTGTITTVGTPPAVTTTTAPSATVDELKAYNTAAIAYTTAASVYLDLNSRGLLTPTVKAATKTALQTALKALNVAHDVLVGLTAGNFQDQLAAAVKATADATALLPQKAS